MLYVQKYSNFVKYAKTKYNFFIIFLQDVEGCCSQGVFNQQRRHSGTSVCCSYRWIWFGTRPLSCTLSEIQSGLLEGAKLVSSLVWFIMKCCVLLLY